jgi:hypothetical protein
LLNPEINIFPTFRGEKQFTVDGYIKEDHEGDEEEVEKEGDRDTNNKTQCDGLTNSVPFNAGPENRLPGNAQRLGLVGQVSAKRFFGPNGKNDILHQKWAAESLDELRTCLAMKRLPPELREVASSAWSLVKVTDSERPDNYGDQQSFPGDPICPRNDLFEVLVKHSTKSHNSLLPWWRSTTKARQDLTAEEKENRAVQAVNSRSAGRMVILRSRETAKRKRADKHRQQELKQKLEIAATNTVQRKNILKRTRSRMEADPELARVKKKPSDSSVFWEPVLAKPKMSVSSHKESSSQALTRLLSRDSVALDEELAQYEKPPPAEYYSQSSQASEQPCNGMKAATAVRSKIPLGLVLLAKNNGSNGNSNSNSSGDSSRSSSSSSSSSKNNSSNNNRSMTSSIKTNKPNVVVDSKSKSRGNASISNWFKKM